MPRLSPSQLDPSAASTWCPIPQRTEAHDRWVTSWAAWLVADLRRASHDDELDGGMVRATQRAATRGGATALTTSTRARSHRGCTA